MQETARTRLCGKSGAVRFTESVTEEALPNSEFETHIHPNEIEIYLFSEGDLFFVFEDKRIAVEKGMIIAICNDTHHRPIIKKPCKYARTHVFVNKKALINHDSQNLELYKRLSKSGVLIIPPQTASASGMKKQLEEIKEYLTEGSAYNEFCATITALSLLIRIERLGGECGDSTFLPYGNKTAEIMEWIGNHLDKRLNYQVISEKFHISQKYLYSFFKKETGITLSQYILERRIIKAKSVLSAGGTAGEASSGAGFDDYSVFYRSFIKTVGMTPTEYIKQLKN